MNRRKVECCVCKKEKFCYLTEVKFVIYKEPGLTLKVEDWICLDCSYQAAREVDKLSRQRKSIETWLIEQEVELVKKEVEKVNNGKEVSDSGTSHKL